MAGNLANEGENFVLNFLLNGVGTPPSNIYLGLATSTINDEDTLASISEVSDANYSRQEITFTSPIQVAGKGTVKNNLEFQFPAWNEDQQTEITYAFLTDAASGTTGMNISWFELVEPEQPLAGQVVNVRQSDLIFDID